MKEIIGNTTTTPVAQPDWLQTDETKVDYIKNKPTIGNFGLIPTTQIVHGDGKIAFSSVVDDCILNINYETLLAFDTSEIVIGGATSPILGVGMLGYMVLA